MKRIPGMQTFLALIAMLLLATFGPLGAPRAARASVPPAPAPAPAACAPNVPGQLAVLKHHGEALGFHRGASPDPTGHDHYQSIQRRDPTTESGPPSFFVSRSGEKGGNLLVVQLQSRDRTGERVRSNRLQRGVETSDTPPPAEDRVVKHLTFDGGSDGLPHYTHVGGMQLVDDLLVVALEDPVNEEGAPALPATTLAFFDVSVPQQPVLVRLQGLVSKDADAVKDAGAVAVAKRPGGGYLYAVGGPDDNNIIVIYESNDPRKSDKFDFKEVDRWEDEEYDGPGGWPEGYEAFQSLAFLHDCDGTLYLLGTRHNTAIPGFGKEEAYLFRAELSNEAGPRPFALRFVRQAHFFCESAAGTDCDFAAAAAPYVSPAGELLLYATEHDNDGPAGTVRMSEFRHRDAYRPGSSNYAPRAFPGGRYAAQEGAAYAVQEGAAITLDAGLSTPRQSRPWAELYDDTEFEDRSVVFDWADRQRDDFDDFRELDDDADDLGQGFTDKASSARWFAPVGCNITLFEDDHFGGRAVVLEGKGEVQAIPNLAAEPHKFGDDASSIAFNGDCDDKPLTYAWDLDGQPGFEADGARRVFDAAYLDGPRIATVKLRVCDPFGACTVAKKVECDPLGACTVDEKVKIEIRNVAPVFESLTTEAEVPEQGVVTVRGTFTDQGKGDTHLLGIAWGDGTTSAVNRAVGERSFAVQHRYADDDPTGTPTDAYTIEVQLTDDDSGLAARDLPVTVKNVAPVAAIDAITDEVGGVIGVDTPGALKGLPIAVRGSFSDVGAEDTHTATIDWGDGTAPTTGVSGTHVYGALGRYTITLTVTDDDGGTHTIPRQIDVLDAAEAAQSAIDMLRGLLADPALPPASASAIRDALAKLEGNGGGATNGALDKLASGELAAALTKLEQSLGYLTAAEAANPGQSLTAPKRALALAARSVAVEAIAEAEKVASTPATRDKVAQARTLLAQGDALLRAGDYDGAVTKYKAAVSKAQEALAS